MRILDETKKHDLVEFNIDFTKGYLKQDVLITHKPEVREVKEQFHYKVIREYPSGGKDVEKVVDVEGVEYSPAHDETEDILVYIKYTDDEIIERKKQELRDKREQECFPVINRGKLWYSKLNQEQEFELELWYEAWLSVTDTLIEPVKPSWIK